jgi:hypothetical protein
MHFLRNILIAVTDSTQPEPLPIGSIINWTIGGLGAIGGVVYLKDKIKKQFALLRQRLVVWRQFKKDYYFQTLDVACRVVTPSHFKCMRIGKLVSLQNDLKGFLIGVGPIENIDLTICSSDVLTATDAAINETAWRPRKMTLLSFPRPLNKGDSMPINIGMKACTRDGQAIDRHWVWLTEHRVDKLILRVAFESNPPAKVLFCVRDQEGHSSEEETIECDPVSYQFQKIIRWAKPSRMYILKW